MFHLVLHEEAFIKGKGPSELGLSGRGSEADTQGCTHTVDLATRNAFDRGWLLCLEWMWSVWETRLLEGYEEAQVSALWPIFPVVDQRGGGVMGSCDEKYSCYLSLYQEMSGSENKHHRKSEVQKTWTTYGNQSSWLLPQDTPASVFFYLVCN